MTPEWKRTIDHADIPSNMNYPFATIAATVNALILPLALGVQFNTYLANNLLKFLLGKKERAFVTNVYLPELKKAMVHINLPFFYRISILSKYIGVLLKIGWSFLFEEDLIKSPYFKN